MLCWKYCQSQNRHLKLLKIIDASVDNALSHNNISKLRDHLWFHEYLLNSNIWYQSIDKSKKTLVFDVISKTVKKQLHSLQKELKKKIMETNNNENEYWQALINFEERQWKNLRQDMFGGNKPEFTEDELHLSNSANYDSHKEYETNVFLTKLRLIFFITI